MSKEIISSCFKKVIGFCCLGALLLTPLSMAQAAKPIGNFDYQHWSMHLSGHGHGPNEENVVNSPMDIINPVSIFESTISQKDVLDEQIFDSVILPQTQTPRTASMFISPYGGFSKNDLGSTDTDTGGFALGYTYHWDSMSLGFHADLNYTKTDSSKYGMDTDSISGAFGLHANFFVNPNWYIAPRVTIVIGQNDTDYNRTSLNPYDTDTDYNNYAYIFSAKTGYIWDINEKNKITAEIDLSYIHLHVDSYDITDDVNNLSALRADSVSHGDLYGQLKLRWDGEYAFNKIIFKPFAMAGIRHNVTDQELETEFELAGAKFGTDSDDAKGTVILTGLGTNVEYNNFVFNLSLHGDYDSDRQYYGGSFNLTYKY